MRLRAALADAHGVFLRTVLGISLATLRQMVWLTPGGELREKIGSDQHDMVRWIATSCMVADSYRTRAK